MNYAYFPGCTLNTTAKNFDRTARECSRLLGFELTEMERWTCCGATFPLVQDSTMPFLPPARIIAEARATGNPLTTLCSVCYNVIKRTDHLLRQDPEKRKTINEFLETDYQGDLRVIHYLEILRDDLGFDTVAAAVSRPLEGLRAAAYYGCMLLRPEKEMGFDDRERPRVMEDLLRALGAEPVEHPHRTECCGSFQAVHAPEVAVECAHRVLRGADGAGADLVVSTCPLCTFNLDRRQTEIVNGHAGFRRMPVLYLTQVLGLALGLEPSSLGFQDNSVDPMPLLRSRGLA